MKKQFYSLVLVLCALMLCSPAQVKAQGTDKIFISSLFDLQQALRNGEIPGKASGEIATDVTSNNVLVLTADIEWDQKANNVDVLVVGPNAGNKYYIDLNGHTIKRNISDPVGEEGTSVIIFKPTEVVGAGALHLFIRDSKGGGQIIANASSVPTGGNYLCAVLFPSTSTPDTKLTVQGGDLISTVNNNGAPNCFGIIDKIGCEVYIYGGNHSGYMSRTSNTPTLGLYGGTLGSTYNTGSGNFPALQISGTTPQGTWKACTIYGVTANTSGLFSAHVPAESNVYLNGSSSSASALDALSASNKQKAKIEIEEEYDLVVKNTTVTSRNAADILGNGTVYYDGMLHLKNASISGDITSYMPDINIVLEGSNSLNGQLLGYGSNIKIQTIDEVISSSAQHTLTITCSSETPISLTNGNLIVERGVGLTVNGTGNAKAVECKLLDLWRCWFSATVGSGAGPVVSYTSKDLQGVTLKSGSLEGKNVTYEPTITLYDLYILGRQLNAFDLYDSDNENYIEGEGISGKIRLTSGASGNIELENVVIDARGKNVEAMKGSWKNIIFKGTNYILADTKPAIALNNTTYDGTEFANKNGEDATLYIISENTAIECTNQQKIFFSRNNNANMHITVCGNYGLECKNLQTELNINKANVDFVTTSSLGCPVYNVSKGTWVGIQTSDFGGTFEESSGRFLKNGGGYADHVSFRNTASFNLSGTAYPIEVAGVTVTTGNAADVLGDGKISYNASTNTLTLNNANVEGYYTPGIRVTGGGLNIALQGASTVQSSSPNGAIYTVNGDLNINGGAASLDVVGRGMLGLNRMTKNYRTAITGGCSVSASCRDDNFIKSYRSAGMQSDSLYVNQSRLYVENLSSNPTNKVSLYSYNANLEPGLLLVDAEIKEGEPNSPDPLLIVPVYGEGIEQVSGEPKTQSKKIMRDGQLLIIRGDKMYNAQGALVE